MILLYDLNFIKFFAVNNIFVINKLSFYKLCMEYLIYQ